MVMLAKSSGATGSPESAPVLPAGTERHPGYVRVTLAVAVWTMPILVPSGPGNTAAADLTIATACVVVLLWLRRERCRLVVPYLFPVTVLMLAGLVAAHRVGVQTAVLPVVQDGFCLLWAASIANAIRHDHRLLRVVLRAWVRSGIFWAGVLCFGRLVGINWLAGITARDGTRAALTFNDPNLAGNYFVCCLALLLATSVVRRRGFRVTSASLILLAIIFTGSNGAAIGVVVIVAAGLLGAIRRRMGAAALIASTALAAMAFMVLAPHISLTEIQQKAADSIPVLHDSLGRADESSGTREVLVSEAFNLYLHGDLVGVGPGRTKASLQAEAAPYVKEAHNDYTATVVERGALGGAGLVILIWVIGTRFSRVSGWPQPPWVRDLLPRPEYLLGLVCAFAAAGLFYEVLHFRHLWALLGIGAGVDPGLRLAERGVR